MKRRVLSLLLIFSMILPLFPARASAADTANPFRDVKQGDWCYDAVQYVRVNGFFNGTTRTTFNPNDAMTRGMFVTVLGRIAGVDTEQYRGGSGFSDVPADAYFAPYVAWASRHGITAGTGDGKFSPYAYINRQQMAAFFVRYFDAFGVNYGTGANITAVPADIDSVAPYARDAVLKLWREGLLNGDGVNFNPGSRATRAQTAMICYRADKAVETWYKEPGVPSDRVRVELPAEEPPAEEPPAEEPKPAKDTGASGGGSGGGSGGSSDSRCSVSFYDGQRLIETIPAYRGHPLERLPSVAKASKPGAVLVGYYIDAACTRPFYTEDLVPEDIRVYAKYEPLESREEGVLTPTSFARMDQSPYLTFRIRRVSGSVAARDAAVLFVKDGSVGVGLTITPVAPPAPETPADPMDPLAPDSPAVPAVPETLVYTVAADPRFKEGCSYELTLAEGWVFVDEDTGEDMPETIRTAAFSIAMEEVHALRMNEAVKFIEDTNIPGRGDLTFNINGVFCDALTNSAVTDMGQGAGSFTLPAGYYESLSPNDIICVYVGVRPDERRTGSETREPAAYVKVQSVSGSTVTFEALGEEDQKNLYEIPDNFPFLVNALPMAGGMVSLLDLDDELYAVMVGLEAGTVDAARGRLNTGDFVTFHLEEITSEYDVCFGEVTGVSGDMITYELRTREDIVNSMNLYDQVETDGGDLLEEEEIAQLEAQLEEQALESGFAEEAAYLLADMAARTDGFQENVNLQAFLLHNDSGRPSGSFSLVNRPNVRVQLASRGGHFGGVQMTVTVSARLRVPLEDGAAGLMGDYLAIDLEGSFTEEVSFKPTIRGEMLYTELLGFIPCPNGVYLSASLDFKNYTAFAFDAEIFTTDLSGIVEEEIGTVSSQLDSMMSTPSEEAYQKSLEELLERYEELVGREPGWITLVEKKMFSSESCFYGICYGAEGTFVVRADVNLALGSSMEYELGKRFTFWFKVGLFKPTAGNDTMDLLDERFAFQFYVMGKIAVRMGIRVRIYVGIGTSDFASVGLTAEMGPYIKVYGFFIYTYTKYRPRGSSIVTSRERMDGAIGMELGIYFTLGVEARALKIFTYSHDFVDEEIPLFHAGDQTVYYGCSYQPEEDEEVYVVSESSDPADVVMTIPQSLLELDYISLSDGRRGSRALPLDNYYFSVSNPNFSLERAAGNQLKVRVKVPDKVYLLRCDLTVTYRGKLPLSHYDMTTTIPLVWTNLSERQMKEYFTASVRVGNDLEGYDTVWKKKVLRGEEFNLPVGDELKDYARWNDYRYEEGTGYGSQNTASLGIAENTVYDYNVQLKTYSVTVRGIEGGGESSRTYTAKYGEAFDFSDLKNTGKHGSGGYTKFAGFEQTLFTVLGVDEETGETITEPLDITRPINQRMAEALSGGNTSIRARYEDDSVTAVYSFQGVDHEDVTVTTGRGMEPSLSAVYRALSEIAEERGVDNLDIVSITPEHGPISAAENFVVQCLSLSGRRAVVTLDPNGGDPIDSLSRLAGGILTNLPTPTRTGYTFAGWADTSGNTVTNIVVPEEGTTLTAQWTANTYTLTFNGSGGEMDGQSSVTKDVVFDGVYGPLPTPTRTQHRFFGWWTEPDGGGVQVTEATPVDEAENKTLYAYWKPLLEINYTLDGSGGRVQQELFAVNTRNAVYDRNTTYTLADLADLYSQIPGLYDEEGHQLPTTGFNFELKPKIAAGISDGTAHDAGEYILEITRNADELYYAYTEVHDIFVIDKADWMTAIWNTGNFRIEIVGKNNFSGSHWVTVNSPSMDGDLSAEIRDGMRFRIRREGSGFNKTKDQTLNFGERFEESFGNDYQAKIWLLFPSGATSKNYNLPGDILLYEGRVDGTYNGNNSQKSTWVPW